jgi:hypothetical protein
MRWIIALLFFALPLPAQTWVPLASEYQGIDIPSGTTIQARYGCIGSWSKTITIAGPQTQLQVYPNATGMPTGITDAACASRSLQALEGATASTITVHTYTNPPTTKTVIIPASGPPPPPPTPTSITIPANGTCTATINGIATPCTFTINATGVLIITAASLGVTVTP